MTIGDLVKMRYQGNGHPNVGVIVATFQGGLDCEEYKVLWDLQEWSMGSLWKERELVVISASR
jgi:hypothetical protein